MHRIRLISLMLLFTITITVSSIAVSADDEKPSTWPVEVKCIAEPLLPPANWTYPGTILMSGYAGIHGIQAGWETPQVLAFFRNDADGDYPLYGGQLSPDGNWYAAPIGETWAEISFNNYWDVRKVRLYPMSGDGHEITYALSDYRDIFRYDAVAWGYLPIEWQNNATFVVGGLMVQPFDNHVEIASYNYYGSTLDDRYFSPDLTRVFGRVMLDAFGTVVTYKSLQTIDYSVVYGLAKLDNRKDSFVNLGEVGGVSWRRDSAGFIAEVENVAESSTQLNLYDRDGNMINALFDLGQGGTDFSRGASGRNDLLWSLDDKQFAFTYDPPYPQPNRLHIVNLDEHTIMDTCLKPISQPVWSPDGKMLAYLANARENLKIIVIDLETWKAYDIGRQSGSYGWGLPDMVGWRE